MKDKKGGTLVNAFQKIISDSKRKPNKIWVGQGSEFSNNTFNSGLSNNNIEMYSTRNEGNMLLMKELLKH